MKRLNVYDTGQGRYVLVRGPARDLLRDHGVPAVRSRIDRGWNLRRERLGDFLAMAQESGSYAVRLHHREAP